MSRDLQHAIALSFAGRAGHDRAVVYEVGPSVGDSVAWLVRDREVVELTENQIRKPLLGDGGMLTTFTSAPLAGATLMVASDGLWRYAKRDAIVDALRGENLATTATSLIELVRLPNGELQDDAAVVIVR